MKCQYILTEPNHGKTITLTCQAFIQRLLYGIDTHHLNRLRGGPAFQISLWTDDPFKAKLCRFLHTLFDSGYPSYFTCQTNFANHNVFRPCRLIPETGCNTDGYSQVNCRLIKLYPAGDFNVGVLILKHEPDAFFQHRHQKRYTIGINPGRHASRITETRR